MSWLMKWRKGEVEATEELERVKETQAAVLSDTGCQRPINQDCGCIIWTKNGAGDSRGLLVVVADGMGGHKAGEVASKTAVETVAAVYQRAEGNPGEALEEAFRKANQAIYHLASQSHEMGGMGTTCTALAIVGNEAWAAHVGDSRLYLVRGPDIYQLSEDHTAIHELVRQGLLTPEQAEHHEDRNVLVRAMGTKPEQAIMRWQEPMDVKRGDTFILCSDGLHDLVGDSEIRVLASGAPPKEACRKLVQMARERGGYDNITVAVVRTSTYNGGLEVLRETRQVEVNP